MKDYYKILGLKATSSPEDIHAQWIELMRKFHPDRGSDGGAEDERVREINEAYGVLKHPSARAHYDLERTYHRKKRNLYLQTAIVPPIVLIFLFILGLVYIQKPSGTYQRESTFPSTRASIPNVLTDQNVPNDPNVLNALNHLNDLHLTDQTDEIDKIDETNKIDQVNQIDQITQKPVTLSKKPKVAKSPNLRNDPTVRNHPNDINEPNVRKDPNALNHLNDENQKVVALSNKPKVTKVRSISTRKNQTNEIDQTNQINQMNQINDPNVLNVLNEITQTNEIDKIDETNEIDQTSAPSDINEPNDLNDPNVLNALNQTNVYIHPFVSNRPNPIARTNQIHRFVAQLKEPPLLATEGEVKNFFAEYRERYNQKDIEGLLSLFSSRVVQNQRDGFDEIKKIYSDFFDQSQKLNYHMEETRIQIYQNAVEVWARYKIDQTLEKGGKKRVWTGEIRWILLRENGDLRIRFLDFRPQESP